MLIRFPEKLQETGLTKEPDNALPKRISTNDSLLFLFPLLKPFDGTNIKAAFIVIGSGRLTAATGRF